MSCRRHAHMVSLLDGEMVRRVSSQTSRYSRNISKLLDKVFLHDGQIAVRSSLGFGLSSVTGVEAVELEGLLEEVSKVKFTGSSCLRLSVYLDIRHVEFEDRLT